VALPIETTTLHSTANGSDKIYKASIVVNPSGGFDVIGESGPRGQRLKPQEAKQRGVDEDSARRAYQTLVASKIKGKSKYRVIDGDSSVASIVQSDRDGKNAGVPVQLLNAVSASELDELFEHPRMRWMRKINGWRNGIIVDEKAAIGFNRSGQFVPLADDIAAAAQSAFPAGTQIDGELIKGKIIAFDALSVGDRDMTSYGFEERHQALVDIAKHSTSVFIPRDPFSLDTDKAIVVLPIVEPSDVRAFFARLQAINAEGIVGRHADAPVQDGRIRTERVAVKYRLYQSLTARVIRQNAVHSVGVAVYDGSREIDLGDVTIPPSMPLPPPGTSFIEVRYLPTRRGRKLDQPVFLMVRPPGDAGLESCTFDQLVYEAD
jgi:hypothetical protein